MERVQLSLSPLSLVSTVPDNRYHTAGYQLALLTLGFLSGYKYVHGKRQLLIRNIIRSMKGVLNMRNVVPAG